MNSTVLPGVAQRKTGRFEKFKTQSLKRFRPLWLLLPFLVLFFLFQIAPMIWIVLNSFVFDQQVSLENYQTIFNSAFILQAFGNSLWLAFWSSSISLILALFFVASLRKVDSGLRDAVVAFTNMAANFSGVPLAFAFIIILGFNGAVTLLLKKVGLIDDFNLYGQWGLLTLYVYFQVPLATLLLYPAFDALQDDWQAACTLLGAKKWQFWTEIALPVLSPAILGTFIILIANAIGAYASVYALTTGNYNVVTVRIASLVSGDLFLEPNLAAAISVLLMVILGLITFINQTLIRRSYHEKC